MTPKLHETQKDSIDIVARFVLSASGVLNYPHIPDTPGIDKFKGHIFHTARFDYEITGGTQEDPSLTKLKNKTVGILGTGATAIQLVPELAKWAKKLYVFQRTPSSVSERGQRETDPTQWATEIASKKGWQRERNRNFNERLANWPNQPSVNLVDDGWTTFPAYKALIGGPNDITTPESIPAYVTQLHGLDFARQDRVRARVDSIVKDTATAEKLKPWYPGFCKRPCFHDDYLAAFNQPNVELIDTDGKGIDQMTEISVVVKREHYPLDLLVLSTGFRSPAVASSAVGRANITITGRNGRSLEEKHVQGWATLHGVLSKDFPNIFYMGSAQSAVTGNLGFMSDQISTHIAYIISESARMAAKIGGNAKDRYTIEPTEEAEEDWSMQVVRRAGAFAGMSGCTPSYLNAEGDRDKVPVEDRMKAARVAPWGEGIESWTKVIEEWRRDGKLRGIDIKVQ